MEFRVELSAPFLPPCLAWTKHFCGTGSNTRLSCWRRRRYNADAAASDVMLGKYHQRIPKDPKANVQWRLKLYRACAENPKFREGIRELCKRDILFYINAFCWYHNPLKGSGAKVGPFVTWPYQDECILKTVQRWIIDGKDYLWEKSREMGATWMALIIVDWRCLFHQWEQCMAVSHSLIAVENGSDPNSLFWKIRHLHEHLPDWITQGVDDAKKKVAPVISYPATKGSISGYASTGRSGVGGRGKVMLDELGKQQQAHEIVGNTADIGPRLFISTHYGVGSTFADLCRRPDLPKCVMHWSLHPEKNRGLYRFNREMGIVEYICNKTFLPIPKGESDYDWPEDYPYVTDGSPISGAMPGLRSPWYDEECKRRRDNRQVAQHLDISPEGADAQFFNGMTIMQLRLAYCTHPRWEGEIEFDHFTGQPIRLVEKEGGRIKLWLRPDGSGRFPLSRYACGIDISGGVGTTNTVLTVADALTGEKVLEFADPRMSGERFGPMAVAICRLFKGENIDGAFMVWEKQGGTLFAEGVIRCGYRRFYFHRSKVHETLKPTVSDKPGWHSDGKSKKDLLEKYRTALEDRKYINRSFLAMDECKNFRWNMNAEVEHSQEATTNDPTGARENHGDRTMSDCLTWHAMCEIGGGRHDPAVTRQIPIGGWEWRMRRAMEADRELQEEYA